MAYHFTNDSWPAFSSTSLIMQNTYRATSLPHFGDISLARHPKHHLSHIFGANNSSLIMRSSHQLATTCRFAKPSTILPFRGRATHAGPAWVLTNACVPAPSLQNQISSINLRVTNNPDPMHPHLRFPQPSSTDHILPIEFQPINSTVRLPRRHTPGFLPRTCRRYIRTKVLPHVSLPTLPTERNVWLSKYSGARLSRLANAFSNFDITGDVALSRNVSTFIKFEPSHTLTDPRNITPRSPQFCITVGPYWHALEVSLCALPFLVKHRTPTQRDACMRKFNEFEYFITTDFCRFDRSVPPELISYLELYLMELSFPRTEHPLLWAALDLVLLTNGITKHGYHYSVVGTRCSGDYPTSIGNGLINNFLIWLVMASSSYFSVHEGDDGAIATNKRGVDTFVHNLPFFKLLGFTVDYKISSWLPDHIFCGRILYFEGPYLSSMPDVVRQLSKFHINCSSISDQEYLYAKSCCYLHTDRDTPVLSQLCYLVIRALSPYINTLRLRRRIRRNTAVDTYTANRYVKSITLPLDILTPLEPHPDARAALHPYISIAEQLSLEKYYSQLTYLPQHPVMPSISTFAVETNNKTIYPGC